MSYSLAALTLGFLGSFHCIGMCGPITLALPLQQPSVLSRLIGAALYNIGRAVTYAVFGLLFGALGQSFVIGGYQQALSIGVGSFLLLAVLLPSQWVSRFSITRPLYCAGERLKKGLRYLFGQKSHTSVFLIGLLNGLLPCGLVYMGLAGAIATGNAFNGALFMLLFGIGTFPAMLMLSFGGNLLKISVRQKIRKSVPLVVFLMGLLLILRGMNLGIPYLSPELSRTGRVVNSCCHKK